MVFGFGCVLQFNGNSFWCESLLFFLCSFLFSSYTSWYLHISLVFIQVVCICTENYFDAKLSAVCFSFRHSLHILEVMRWRKKKEREKNVQKVNKNETCKRTKHKHALSILDETELSYVWSFFSFMLLLNIIVGELNTFVLRHKTKMTQMVHNMKNIKKVELAVLKKRSKERIHDRAKKR